jgi:alpha-tubulin suppressor-like RCC1 family protein
VGGHSFTQISANNGNVALKSDGSSWSWGQQAFGSLGNNQDVNSPYKSSPVSVVGGYSFTKIIAGGQNGYGLKSDGTCWGWGYNLRGQIGDNTIIDKHVPIQPVGSHSFSDISAGLQFIIGLKANDGSVWAWGLNTSGQIGDNTVTNRSSPVSVVGGHSFIKILAQNACNLALKSDGSCWGWGGNTNGVLGDQSTIHRSSPVSVVGSHNFATLYELIVSAGNILKIASVAWGDIGKVSGTAASSINKVASITAQ